MSIAFKIQIGDTNYICFNVYFPTFCNSDAYEYDILNCFAFIDSILNLHLVGKSQIMLVGDFNFDSFRLNNYCDRLNVVKCFIHEYELSICDDYDHLKRGSSYRHEGLNVNSLID